MKLKLLYIFFFSLTFQMFAQDDNDKKSIKIPAKETKEKDTLPTTLRITPKNDLKITKTDKNVNGIPFKSKVEIMQSQK